MMKMITASILLCFISITRAECLVIEVKNLSEIKEEITNLDTHTLVLFDIDYTLLIPKDLVLKPCGKGLRKKYLHGLDLKQRELLRSILAISFEEELMDVEFPYLIKQLQQDKIPVMALTALETGEYGLIKHLEDWRLNQLAKFEIDFNKFFPDVSPIVFQDMISIYGHYAMFKNGVLFTSNLPKGDVLKAFLKEINWNPKTIIFVDDSLEQIRSVEAAAESMEIKFIGFHYTAAESFAYEFNQKVGEFQLQILVNTHKWLTDAEAEKILEIIRDFYEVPP